MNSSYVTAMLSQLNGATQPKMIKSLFGKYTTAVTEEARTEGRKMIVPILVSQFTLLYVEFGTCKQATNTFNVGARERQARIINCPFSCVLSWSKATDSWRLRVRNAAHNHEPSVSRSMHWRWRRLDMKRHREIVVDMLTRGIPPRMIIQTLRQEYPLLAVQPRDIYNLKRRLHLEFLEGRTPIQALIEAIPENNLWKVRVQTDENNKVTALLALSRKCFRRWFRNPWVLFMDCTYKTNHYKMPLLDILGCDAMNSTFYIGFAFVSDERQNIYEFILHHLKTSYESRQLPQLRTVITDKDDALISAVKAVFPSADNLICIWHINKRILAKAKPLIRSELVHLEDEEEFNEAVESCWRSILEE